MDCPCLLMWTKAYIKANKKGIKIAMPDVKYS